MCGGVKRWVTHVGALVDVFTVEDIPENINRGIRLNCNTGLHTLLMDIFDQFTRTGTGSSSFISRIGRGDGGDGSFIMEAIEIATGFLELVNPFMRLNSRY